MWNKLIQTLPVAATSPFAFVSYVCLLAAYVYVAVSTFRLKRVSKTLSLIPEHKRAAILAKEYSTFPKSGLAPREWLTSRKHLFFFLAFLATLLAVTIIVVIGIQLGHSAVATPASLNTSASQPQSEKQPSTSTGETFKQDDSISTEVRRAKPTIEFNFPTTGEKKQKFHVSVRPNLIQIEPKPTGVKEDDLPMEVPVVGGTITVLRFDSEVDGGYMLFDTSQLPRGTRIRGEIIGYSEVGKTEKSFPTKREKEHKGAEIAQHGNGNGAVSGGINQGPCSNLQIGGANNQSTVNCGPVQRILSDVQREAIGNATGTVPETFRFDVHAVAGEEPGRFGQGI